MQPQLSFARQHAIDFDEHATGRDVDAAADDEAPVLFDRHFDARQRAQLAARWDRRQPGHFRIELVALQRTVDDVVAARGETELGLLGRVTLADKQQRHRTRRSVGANLAAEFGGGHVEEVEREHDQLRTIGACDLQSIGAGQCRGDRGMAATKDRFLEQQRAARMVDQEDAAGAGLGHAAEISRRRPMLRFKSSTSSATCSFVLDRPRPKRIEP